MSLSPAERGYVDPPDAEALRIFLGWPELDEEQASSAAQHLARATRLVRSYVRGQGFSADAMAPDLAEVVLSLAGRTLCNPTSASRIEAGQFSSLPGQPEFSLGDRLILHGHRRRAA